MDDNNQIKLNNRVKTMSDKLDALALGLESVGDVELLSRAITAANTLILNYNDNKENPFKKNLAMKGLIEETLMIMNQYDNATKLDEQRRNECYKEISNALDNLENKFVQNGLVFEEHTKTL